MEQNIMPNIGFVSLHGLPYVPKMSVSNVTEFTYWKSIVSTPIVSMGSGKNFDLNKAIFGHVGVFYFF